MNTEKENILKCLQHFVAQRPGLEFGNYGDVSAYRSELRSITKARHHAETLINTVAWRDSITADHILAASKSAYSGRLTIVRTDTGGFRIDYCTGQYFPTEYRNAVCAVLSAVLWDYWRDGNPYGTKPGAGDYIRDVARKELGRSIAQVWFR
jgi:hypothetical protein